jgi:protein associated with RNAse G/E
LFWEADTWRFDGWYVNLQSPFVRTSLGFDATDDILDIEVEPDGSWAWKDEDELEQAVRAKALTPSRAAAIRREGERVIKKLEDSDGSFPTSFVDWRPDARWPIPELPDGWNSLPGGISDHVLESETCE